MLVAPRLQHVCTVMLPRTRSWMTVKEAALLAGTLAQSVPLPAAETSAAAATGAAPIPPAAPALPGMPQLPEPWEAAHGLEGEGSVAAAIPAGEGAAAGTGAAGAVVGAGAGAAATMAAAACTPGGAQHGRGAADGQDCLLSEAQLAGLGVLLVEQLLLVIKHTGAVDKAEMGLCTLATKALRCACVVCSCVCFCVLVP